MTIGVDTDPWDDDAVILRFDSQESVQVVMDALAEVHAALGSAEERVP